MFEHRHHELAPLRLFLWRIARNTILALAMIAGSLGIGMAGYHHYEKLSWLDSLLNASMILSSMGPVTPVQTDAGKLFASFYALFSGVWFLAVAGVLFAPVTHRFLHKFHLGIEPRDNDEKPIERRGRRKQADP
jgi:predicted membrane channel-forming protein YqfA (hemolysin III family)